MRLNLSPQILFVLFFCTFSQAGEINSWECSKFEDAKIYSDSSYLGSLGPSWSSDSIFNTSSEYSTTWSQNSIFNDSSNYGNSYSNKSVFNDTATSPPIIISKNGEIIGYLSIGPDWDSERFHPMDIKYSCDWD